MRHSKNNNILTTALLLLSLLLVPNVLAKDKPGQTPQNNAPILFDGEQVRELLVDGAFWCLGNEGNSCLFTNLVIEEVQGEYRYDVVGLWDEETILYEYRWAQVFDDGILCENSAIYLKGIRASDLDGTPVSSERLNALLQELDTNYSKPEVDSICFRYGMANPDSSDDLIQYEIDTENNLIDPITFSISYDANAAQEYTLRW